LTAQSLIEEAKNWVDYKGKDIGKGTEQKQQDMVINSGHFF